MNHWTIGGIILNWVVLYEAKQLSASVLNDFLKFKLEYNENPPQNMENKCLALCMKGQLIFEKYFQSHWETTVLESVTLQTTCASKYFNIMEI